MNVRGAAALAGPPRQGFTVDVARPKDVTVHGNFDKGFYVHFVDTDIEYGPYREPQRAYLAADRMAGVLERAN